MMPKRPNAAEIWPFMVNPAWFTGEFASTGEKGSRSDLIDATQSMQDVAVAWQRLIADQMNVMNDLRRVMTGTYKIAWHSVRLWGPDSPFLHMGLAGLSGTAEQGRIWPFWWQGIGPTETTQRPH
jgi:hypothetical protein